MPSNPASWLLTGALAALLAACAPDPATAPSTGGASGGVSGASVTEKGSSFDFYVLSLSWSPSYCESEGADANRQQCDGRRTYAFVVHGLWPQFERGYPENCATGEPTDVPREKLSELYDIMPSAGLIRHQWRKHGSCAGLSQADYFDAVRAARNRVEIPAEFRGIEAPRTVDPDQVEASFISANPGLDGSGIAVTCDRRYLREVRICMSKGLEFRPCPEVDRRACRMPSAVMPPARGG